MEDGFYRIDENGDHIAMSDDEIKAAVEELYSRLGISDNDGNDDNEELPAPPEEIFVDMSSIE